MTNKQKIVQILKKYHDKASNLDHEADVWINSIDRDTVESYIKGLKFFDKKASNMRKEIIKILVPEYGTPLWEVMREDDT